MTIPLSLYIHLPWCIHKCPYCDFNSHALSKNSSNHLSKDLFKNLEEEVYINALISDFDADLFRIQDREICSIFFGGGTPSLFSPQALERLLLHIQSKTKLLSNIEITLEANPGTADANYFDGYHRIGINRLSLGVQSFQDDKLKALGRIHDAKAAFQAYDIALKAGFENINIDLMHSLPHQTVAEACKDIQSAISLSPSHLSWYQLTLEPHTLFAHRPPPLPQEDVCEDIFFAGQDVLKTHHYDPYEISAYCKDQRFCKHNLNYWEFGDYLGIGAGAHSKITDIHTHQIQRFYKLKHPNAYLAQAQHPIPDFIAEENSVLHHELSFEFMLNTLRLFKPVTFENFQARTFLSSSHIENVLKEAQSKGLIKMNASSFETTEQGKRYLNNLLEMFLEK